MSNEVTALRPLERSLLSSLRTIAAQLAQPDADGEEATEAKTSQRSTRKRRSATAA
jgi:hypothetical protein